MLNKFISGLIFGLGFAISVIVVFILSLMFIAPKISHTNTNSIIPSSSLPSDAGNTKVENDFNHLSIEEKIKSSTAVMVTEIGKDSSGEYKEIISDILMVKDGVSLYYKKGDVYDNHIDFTRYPNESDIPKGFIIFMTGNPANMYYSVSYSGDRVNGLGGIPMALLKEKCGT